LASITALLVRLFPRRPTVVIEPVVAKVEFPSTKSPHAPPPSAVSVSSTQSQPMPPE
jgi:hypothetical protein